ncbi:hypothetical protein PtA15_1A146 [Puccinia triticina]|uniref:Uncharacterized protein n=1 Tax=Puccinia triticina TaxID=208348 RepID=A0ABY7C7E8_9BASI|nr:uncharacterized protein PtA15_1A146 [Puccinia triticina]WAQ80808.1 hypothetical protein PtA15_1A146 [Puccinia triticina]
MVYIVKGTIDHGILLDSLVADAQAAIVGRWLAGNVIDPIGSATAPAVNGFVLLRSLSGFALFGQIHAKIKQPINL